MRLDLFRNLDGVVGPDARHPSLAGAMPELVQLGYAGVIAPVALAESIPDFRSQLGERGLDYIAMVATDGDTVAEHVRALEQGLADAEFHRPRLVVAESGRSTWSEADASAFCAAATRIEEDLPFVVGHQSLRGRLLGDPDRTDALVAQFPELHLTADFAQWVWACGHLLEDRLDVVRRCAARAVHVNAGVGSVTGPRVPDPAAADWAPHLAAHERWWSLVWDEQERAGAAATTLTPDAPSWEIASWLGDRQRARFADR
jgi:hypothetical protein